MSLSTKYRIPFTPSRIKLALKKYSIGKLFSIAINRIYDNWYDSKYNLDTVSLARLEDLKVGKAGQSVGNQYQPTGVRLIRKILKVLSKYEKKGFVDFGSGKGQVLIEASRFSYNQLTGVEFSEELCEVARSNIRNFESKTKTDTNIKIAEMDAAKFEIDANDDLLYFFNPFKEDLLISVLDKIIEVNQKYPKERILAYYYPLYKHCFDERFEFIEEHDLNEDKLRIYRLKTENK